MSATSLRARLTVGLLALAAAGLVVANVATYASMRSFLNQRVSQQLDAARMPALRALFDGRPDRPRARQAPAHHDSYPPGSYAAIVDPAATVVAETWLGGPLRSDRPVLPEVLPASFTAPSQTGEAGRYRVRVEPLRGGGAFVVAVPLREMQQTLARLVLIMAAVGIAVLVALGAGARWLVRLGLSPLERMGLTAAEIAAGDLSRRVEPADDRTEVGRLGMALNSMLAQIETAFAERRASEERLRRFLADASHELRTPLTSIRGYAELFRRGARTRPDDLEAAMTRIEQEAARMGVLVEDLLMLARLDEGRPPEMAPVDLSVIAADAMADAKASDPDRPIRLSTPGPVVVHGDEVRLRQVLANLMSNAIEHTPPGAGVEVSVSWDREGAVLQVRDHGPGLRPEEAERVFERFYRSDPSRARDTGGAGLGLSIVKAIVDAHGGRVTVSETPGGGATFSVRLPGTHSRFTGAAHGDPSRAWSDVSESAGEGGTRQQEGRT